MDAIVRAGNRRRSAGLTSVWTVLVIILLMLFLSFELDMLYVVGAAQQLQVGADAASLAGAQLVKTDQSAARADAVTYANANGVPPLIRSSDNESPQPGPCPRGLV